MSTLNALEKDVGLVRGLQGQLAGLPFTLLARVCRWEIDGAERLLAAAREHQRTGRGLVTVSNHVSLFDDPLVFVPLLGIKDLNELSKCWYSTACADNFNPSGGSLRARVVRRFSEVSNMVFMSRAHKRGHSAVEADPQSLVGDGQDVRFAQRVGERAKALGVEPGRYPLGFFTPAGPGGDQARCEALNQAGMIEACMRVDSGDWLHFFPEGGRSRDLSLRPARAGVGKVLFHTDPLVVPFCLYGTERVLPVGAKLPAVGQRIVIHVGEPVPASAFAALRTRAPSVATYQALADVAMGHVASLRPRVLEQYLGAHRAAEILASEAIAQEALQARPEASTLRAATPPVSHVGETLRRPAVPPRRRPQPSA